MNQKICSGLTAAFLATALSTTPSCQAQQIEAVPSKSEANYKAQAPTTLPSPPANAQSVDVVKVGEYQSQSTPVTAENTIAKIQTHEVAGRKAATLYVRNIPVLTFIGSNAATHSETKVGEPGNSQNTNQGNRIQVAANAERQPSNPQDEYYQVDPVERATAVAAQLNQLNRDNVDANTITVRWAGQSQLPTSYSTLPHRNADATEEGLQPTETLTAYKQATRQQELSLAPTRRSLGAKHQTTTHDFEQQSTLRTNRTLAVASSAQRYIIKVDGEDLVAIDGDTRLPDTTNNLAEDALQATNRLRRLMGNAPPLSKIIGRPAPAAPEVSLVRVISRFRGIASWYGPGFHGNRSASGEIYNQNALTAAHRNLPFGTQVRVTNLNNGRSVVVRINDRGPYSRGRIIDLSAAAARLIGLTQSGVAPVSLDVLGKPQTVAIDEE